MCFPYLFRLTRLEPRNTDQDQMTQSRTVSKLRMKCLHTLMNFDLGCDNTRAVVPFRPSYRTSPARGSRRDAEYIGHALC
jgi:hypothetical protein